MAFKPTWLIEAMRRRYDQVARRPLSWPIIEAISTLEESSQADETAKRPVDDEAGARTPPEIGESARRDKPRWWASKR